MKRSKKVVLSREIFADDITRKNQTKVSGIFFIRTQADIEAVIKKARKDHKYVSIRGQTHTMGGQTIANDGYVMDLKYFNSMRYDESSEVLTVEPGATWTQVIQYLNTFGRSPSIQSD